MNILFDVNDHAFNWEDNFPQIVKGENGFSVAVGNPPYVRPHNLNPRFKQYLSKYYSETYKEKSDLYNCFIQRGINLLKENRLISFIVPHTWTSSKSFFNLRKFMLDKCKIIKLVQLPNKVFRDATVKTCIFVLSKENNSKAREDNEVVVECLNEKGEVTFVKRFRLKRS